MVNICEINLVFVEETHYIFPLQQGIFYMHFSTERTEHATGDDTQLSGMGKPNRRMWTFRMFNRGM